jgi:hypothetical protein
VASILTFVSRRLAHRVCDNSKEQRTMEPVISAGGGASDHRGEPRIALGAGVEVFSTFTRTWVRGFAIADAPSGGYRLVRLSDGAVLQPVFPRDQVRETWP